MFRRWLETFPEAAGERYVTFAYDLFDACLRSGVDKPAELFEYRPVCSDPDGTQRGWCPSFLVSSAAAQSPSWHRFDYWPQAAATHAACASILPKPVNVTGPTRAPSRSTVQNVNLPVVPACSMTLSEGCPDANLYVDVPNWLAVTLRASPSPKMIADLCGPHR